MEQKTYTTLRGREVVTRPYAMIPIEERRQILIEALADPKETRKRHNISAATLHHIRWHCYKLLEGQKTVIDQIHELRDRGMTSLQVSKELNLSLERVNKLWAEPNAIPENQVSHQKQNYLTI